MFVQEFILLLGFINGMICEKNYISVLKGTDTPDCGTEENQCQTINYAIKRTLTNDTILLVLDGGTTMNLEYLLDQDIVISKGIHTMKHPKSNYFPIIAPTKNYTGDYYAISIKSSTLQSVNVSADSIVFKNIGIVSLKELSVSLVVTISNCSAMKHLNHKHPSAFVDVDYRKLTKFLSVAIKLIDCRIESLDVVYYTAILPAKLNLTISRTTITAGQVNILNLPEVRCKSKTLRENRISLQNVNMLQSQIPAITIIGCFSISFSNVKFKGNKKAQNSSSSFLGVKGFSSRKLHMQVEKISFENIKTPRHTLFNCIYCDIYGNSMTFIRNTAINAFAISNSNVSLKSVWLAYNIVLKGLSSESNTLSIINIVINGNRISKSGIILSRTNLSTNSVLLRRNMLRGDGVYIYRKSFMSCSKVHISKNSIAGGAFLIAFSSLAKYESVTIDKNIVLFGIGIWYGSFLECKIIYVIKNNLKSDVVNAQTSKCNLTRVIIVNNTIGRISVYSRRSHIKSITISIYGNKIGSRAYYLVTFSKLILHNLNISNNTINRDGIYLAVRSEMELNAIMIDGNTIDRYAIALSSLSRSRCGNIIIQNNRKLSQGLQVTKKAILYSNTIRLTENKIHAAVIAILTATISVKNITFTSNNVKHYGLALQLRSTLRCNAVEIANNNISRVIRISAVSRAYVDNLIMRKNVAVYGLHIDTRTVLYCAALEIALNDLKGIAIIISFASNATFKNIKFQVNTLKSKGILCKTSSTVRISNLEFLSTNLDDLAVHISSYSQVTLTKISMKNNTCVRDAIYVGDRSVLICSKIELIKNKLGSRGIALWETNSTILHIIIVNNTLGASTLTIATNTTLHCNAILATGNNIGANAIRIYESTSTFRIIKMINNIVKYVVLSLQRTAQISCKSLEVVRNTAESAIFARNFSIPVFEIMVIKNNTFRASGILATFVDIFRWSILRISKNIINGAAIGLQLTSSTFKEVTITDNTLEVGVYFLKMRGNCSSIKFVGNIVKERSVVFTNSHFVTFSAITLINNTAEYGIYCTDSSINRFNTTILTGNYFKYSAIFVNTLSIATFNITKTQLNNFHYGLYVSLNSKVIIQQFCYVINNNFTSDLIHAIDGSLHIFSSILEDNNSSLNSRALLFSGTRKQELILKNTSIVWNNVLSDTDIVSILSDNSTIVLDQVNIDIKVSKQRSVGSIYLSFNPINHLKKVLISLSCPSNQQPMNSSISHDILLEYRLSCIACPNNFYSLAHGKQRVTGTNYITKSNEGNPLLIYRKMTRNHSILYFKDFNTSSSKSLRCRDCPIGGRCENGIRSTGNYFGYLKDKKTIKFIFCPPGYCCEPQNCISFNTCGENRRGLLCGSCIKGYYDDYFIAKCSPIHTCKKQILFWVCYITFTFFLTFILFLLTDLKSCVRFVTQRSKTIQETFITKHIDNNQNTNGESSSDYDNIENVIIVPGKPRLPISEKFSMAGIISILIGFYQTRTLLKFDAGRKSQYIIANVLENVFNLQFNLKIFSAYCPTVHMNAISKVFVKEILVIILMLLFIVTSLCIYQSINQLQSKNQNDENETDSNTTFKPNLYICYIRILVFGHKNLAIFSIIMFNCVNLNNKNILYINGNIQCYTWWQIFDLIFLFTWVCLFPLALSIGYYMYKEKRLSLLEFMLILTFPLALLLYYMKRKANRFATFTDAETDKRLKLMLYKIFEEPYRVREKNYQKHIFYETHRMYHRLVLALAATIIINPLQKLTIILLLLAIIHLHYSYVDPYKKELVMIKDMERMSMIGIYTSAMVNQFKMLLYVYEISSNQTVDLIFTFFSVIELIFTPLVSLLFYLIAKPILLKCVAKIRKKND